MFENTPSTDSDPKHADTRMGAASQDAESISEILKSTWYTWAANLIKLKPYFRTRHAILNGEPLFDLSPTELVKRRLMRPLEMNVFQSALSSSLGLAILLFLSADHGAPERLDLHLPIAQQILSETSDMLPAVDKLLLTPAVPIIFLALASILFT